ncbi:hypothetical protein PV11_06820 [Exophiala sideris]|uniref:Uncharacterized protein n=1 Tax=Exophiala sideris TaxID=1016849 RepID=A0A0D1WVR5_9EURO|nr:hypothetical protein PV11_06820 [Exophiala sideris]
MARARASDGPSPRPALAPWTASRCNRVLRQLTSFVNRIEKWHQSFLAAQEEEKAQIDVLERSGQPVNESSDWLTTGKGTVGTKRSRKNYSTRRTTAAKTPLPKRILPQRQVKTPRSSAEAALPIVSSEHIAAAGEYNSSYDAAQLAQRTDVPLPAHKPTLKLGAPFSHEWSPGTSHLGHEYEDILRQGYTTISTFLNATSDPNLTADWDDFTEPYKRPGARSLFEMTLSKVSNDVVEQQKQNDVQNDGYNGQHDFIGSQLQELEDYFGDSRQGWPLLRKVVRNCGIYMITRMLKTGALLDTAAIHLADRCWIDSAMWDFEQAIWGMLVEAHTHNLDVEVGFHHLPGMHNVLELSETKNLDIKLSALWTLQAVKEANDPVAVIERFIRYSHLVLLVIEKHGGRKEEEPSGFVDALLETIYVGSMSVAGRADQRVLLRKQCSKSQKQHDVHSGIGVGHVMSEALFNRLKHPLILLLSSCYGDKAPQYRPLIEKFSKYAQISVELDISSNLSDYQQHLAAILFFANLCQRLTNGCDVSQDLLGSLNMVLTDECISAASDAFVAMVFALRDESEGFKELIPQLLGLDCGHFRRLARAVAEICAAAAMEHAATNDADQSAVRWAVGVVDAVTAKIHQSDVSGPRTPSTKPLKHYQWDDDVAEWIARTPEIRQLIYGGHEQDQRSPSGRHSRPALADISSNATKRGDGLKPKSLNREYETHSDGDFVFRKPKRKLGRDENVDMMERKPIRTQRRRLNHLSDESEDELSFLD